MLRLCAAAAVLVAVVMARPPNPNPPPFCHGIDCPVYKVLNTTNDYETRYYEESQWARTLIKGMEFDNAESEGFHRLFDYISGDNKPKQKVEMTAPVLTRIDAGQGPFCDSNFTVSFMVPFANQPNPPEPSAKNVYIANDPARTAYVYTFSGFAQQDDVVKAATNLAEALGRDGVQFDPNFFMFAGYDSPFRIVDRHNEVWFFPPGTPGSK